MIGWWIEVASGENFQGRSAVCFDSTFSLQDLFGQNDFSRLVCV